MYLMSPYVILNNSNLGAKGREKQPILKVRGKSRFFESPVYVNVSPYVKSENETVNMKVNDRFQEYKY